MSTAVIGTAFVDVKGFSCSEYDPRGRNMGSVSIVHGGVGRNVAENFANIGMPVSFVGMLEDSAFGRDVEAHLKNIGADLKYCLMLSEGGIGIWLVILGKDGDLMGSISKMPDLGIFEEYILNNGDEIVSAADEIILEIDLNETIAEKVMELAEKYGKKVYVLVGNLSVAMARPDLLRKTDCFICNEIEAAKLFHEKDLTSFTPEQMKDYLPSAAGKAGIKSMVVTMGANGSVYYDCSGGEDMDKTVCGICPVETTEKVTDTSGAGDAFFSGTVMALINGYELSEAVKYGTHLAAETIQRTENVCPVISDFLKR